MHDTYIKIPHVICFRNSSQADSYIRRFKKKIMFYRPTPSPSLGFWHDLTHSLPRLCSCMRPLFKVGSMPRGLAGAVWRLLCLALISTAQLKSVGRVLWQITTLMKFQLIRSPDMVLRQRRSVEIFCHESYKTHVVHWLAWLLLSTAQLHLQFRWCCTLCVTVVSHWLWAEKRFLSDKDCNIQYISFVDVSVIIKYSCLDVHR